MNSSGNGINVMYQLSKSLVAMTDELSALENRKKTLQQTGMEIGITFLFESDKSSFGTPDIDLIINVDLGSDDPLRDEWLNFQKRGVLAIEKAIAEKKLQINDIMEQMKQ